ncbi:MAG: HAMP domain-containing protein [Candidatus Nanopelagicales bacterium]
MSSAAAATGFWSRRGVRARSVTAAVVVVAVALLVGGTVLLLVLNVALTSGVRGSVEQRVLDVVALISDDDIEEAESTVDASPVEGIVVQIVAADGTVALASSAIADQPAIDTGMPASAEVRTVRMDLQFEADPALVAWAAAATDDGMVTVAAAQSLAAVQRVIGLVLVLLAVGSPLLLIAVGVITWVAVGRSLRSVDRIRAGVETIDSHDLAVRVPVPAASDEIARLAVTMNHMLDRLQASSAAQRRFVADASHELKSPLASIGPGRGWARGVGRGRAGARRRGRADDPAGGGPAPAGRGR